MILKDAQTKEMIFALFLQYISSMQTQISTFKFTIGSIREPDCFDVIINFTIGSLTFKESICFDFETTENNKEVIKELKTTIFEMQEKIEKIRKIS